MWARCQGELRPRGAASDHRPAQMANNDQPGARSIETVQTSAATPTAHTNAAGSSAFDGLLGGVMPAGNDAGRPARILQNEGQEVREARYFPGRTRECRPRQNRAPE